MKIVKVAPLMTVIESDALAGQMLNARHCHKLFNYDVDVYDKESGKCLAKFRKGVIPISVQKSAWSNLLSAAKQTSNRGTAGGGDKGKVSQPRKLKDGRISKTNIAENLVDSGIVGYFDRNARFPLCRLTAFTQKHFDKFKAAYPIIKLVDNFYAELMPKEYKRQKTIADKTSKDFVIKGTSFSTVTVNKNYQTAVHKDAGDFKEGFGNLVAMRHGQYDGCYFTLVRWGIGFDLQNGDLLLTDVHQWHGNTPMIKLEPKATRLSLVMYYRQNMIHCETVEKEINRTKNRKVGAKLNG